MTELEVQASDGFALTAIAEGVGPTLLVVHPGSVDETSWSEVASRLADRYRVVRMRRRIYDRATIRLPHTVRVEADDIIAVARRLDRPIVLVGHSSGAVAALEAALQASRTPDPLFAGLVLYEPPLPTTSLVAGAAGKRAREALDAGDPVEAVRIHLRDIVGMPAAGVDGLLAHVDVDADFTARIAGQIADNEAIDGLPLGTERYTSFPLPVTLVEGELSPAHLRRRVADLAAALPHCRTVELPGQGHLAHAHAPGLLAEVIDAAARRMGPSEG